MDASQRENKHQTHSIDTGPQGAGEPLRDAPLSLIAERNREAEAQWAARLVCAGSFLTLVYEVFFLILDRRFLSLARPNVLLFHGINILLFVLAVIMALRVGPWMRQHWKSVAFSFSGLMIASSACIAVETAQVHPLTFALILFLAGTGPFLCWGEQPQAWLSVIAVVAFAAVNEILPADIDWYQWLGVLIGAAIGLFSTGLERRLRRAQHHAEEQLLKSRETLVVQERVRMAGELAAGIAHDLNNDLYVMKLRLAVLMADQEVRTKYQLQLDTIDRTMDDAAQTIARVLELGKPARFVTTETARLSEIIVQAIDLARTTIEEKSALAIKPIQIEWSSTPQLLPEVRGTASEIRQMLINLFLNASDAMQCRGKILVESDLIERAVLLHISDEGAGIPEDHLERIFEPFFTTKGSHGTGLGLAIARKVMDDIGGKITAANRPHGGAVFTLIFPLAAAPAPVIKSPPLPHDRSSFLLVDDDAKNLAALKEILLLKGHAADTALSGAEAIGKLRSEVKYDIVLCDLGMPDITGWEVAREASRMELASDFYIITGWAGQPQANIPADVKVRGVLAKPIGTGEIDHIVSDLSRRIGSRQYTSEYH